MGARALEFARLIGAFHTEDLERFEENGRAMVLAVRRPCQFSIGSGVLQYPVDNLGSGR